MSGDEELQDRLRRLARAVPQEAGGAAERALRAKFRAQRRQTKRLWAYVAEAAAMIAAVLGLYLALTHGRSKDHGAATAAGISPVSVNRASGFIMLPYAQSDVPMEQPVIVRMQIPASELGAIGMPLPVTSPSGKVNAELLVGQDGVARAVRVVE